MAVLTTNPTEQANLALERELCEHAAHVHAGTALLVALLERYDRSDAWRGPGIRSVAHWANIDLGLDTATAHRYLRLGRALRDLPVVAAAFAAGTLSAAKADLVVRAAEIDSQAHWVEVATAASTTQLGRIVAAWERVVTDPEPATEARTRRGVWFSVGNDGLTRLTAALAPDDAAVVRAAVDAFTEAAWREHNGVPANDPTADAVDPSAARRADALVELAETGLAAGPTPCVGGDRTTVTVHAHAGAVEHLDPATPEPDGPARRGRCHLRDGTTLDAHTLRRLACDATIRPLLEDDHRRPLDLGRTRRLVSATLRRFVEARDGGCAFPGCTATRFVDIHHIRHWLDGGATDAANLLTLCRHHHRAQHHGDFTIEAPKHRSGAATFRRPDGTRIAPPPPLTVEPDGLARTNPAGITHRTAAATDGGAPIRHLDLVIDATLSATGRSRC